MPKSNMTMKQRQLFLFVFLAMLALSRTSHAFDITGSSYPSTIIKASQHNYSGFKYKSFSDSPTGYSGGITLLTQREYFVPYVGISFGGQSSRQSFIDNGIAISSPYTYNYTSGEAGMYFFPIGRNTIGLNLYINGAGLASYQSIALDTNATLTKISKTDQNFSTGYKGNVGFEWILKNRGSRTKWTIYTEFGFKKETVELLKQNFVLDSLSYTVGLGW
jgi:hypothetical protein